MCTPPSNPWPWNKLVLFRAQTIMQHICCAQANWSTVLSLSTAPSKESARATPIHFKGRCFHKVRDANTFSRDTNLIATWGLDNSFYRSLSHSFQSTVQKLFTSRGSPDDAFLLLWTIYQSVQNESLMQIATATQHTGIMQQPLFYEFCTGSIGRLAEGRRRRSFFQFLQAWQYLVARCVSPLPQGTHSGGT